MDAVHLDSRDPISRDGIEKYRMLYEMSKSAFDEETARFGRLDQKASTYFAALTVAFSAFALMAAVVFDPRTAMTRWVTVLLCVASIAEVGCILLAWRKVLHVVKVQTVRRPPHGEELIRFVDENKLIDIYYALSQKMGTALDENRTVSDLKATHLQSAYGWTTAAVVVLVAYLLVFIVQSLLVPR